MTANREDQLTNPQAGDEKLLLSRRRMLSRMAFGITGIGAATILAACGGDDEEPVGVPPNDPAGVPGDDPAGDGATGDDPAVDDDLDDDPGN